MTRILRVDASSRTRGSHSRELADVFLSRWLKARPDDEVVSRDLVTDPVPHIEDMTIAGYYTPKEEHSEAMKAATALSDQLINELLSADVLLISTPMYNFSVPSVLKAYIDQIVRIGYTFGFDEEKGLYGLIEGKRAVVFTASGAVFSDATLKALNYLEPYLKTVLGFLGIADIEFIAVEGTTTDEAALARSRSAALDRIDRLCVA